MPGDTRSIGPKLPFPIILKVTVPAIHAWDFINADEAATWCIENDVFRYHGCHLLRHIPVNADEVQLIFDFALKERIADGPSP